MTVEGFKFVAIGNKTIRITDPTSNVIIRNNHIVGAENTALAGTFTLLETDYNETQTMHVITGNTFEAHDAAQAVYYNPTTIGLIFTNNTFTGTIKDGGVGVVVDALSSFYDISGNDFTGLGGDPYAMMGLPGLDATEMDAILLGNDFPAGYAVVGTDIMIPSGTIEQDGGTGQVLGGEPLVITNEDGVVSYLGEIAWYPADETVGRTAGNRVGVEINAPAGFDTAGTTFTVFGSTYTWDAVNDGDNFVWIYPKVTTVPQEWPIVVTWVEGAEQTFIVKVLETSTLQAPIIGTIEPDRGTGQVPGGDPLVITNENDVVSYLGEIAWYPAVEGLRSEGNRVGVEINAPAGYDTSTTTFTVFGSTYTWDAVNDGDNFVWIYPKVTLVPQSWDIVVTWQPGIEQTFTVEVLAGSTLQVPLIGSIEPDGGTGLVYGNEAIVTNIDGVVSYLGEIAWYPADETVGRTAGNRVGVEINAPAGFLTPNTTFTVFGNTYNWNDVNDGDNFVWIYPKVTEVPQEWDIVVTWQEGVTETFTVKVLADSTLQGPQGTIEPDGGTGQVLGGEPLVITNEHDVVTYTGEIAWYPADEALGRTAGNRVGVEINAPAGLDTTGTTFTVFGNTYTWDEVKDGDNFVWIYPLVTEVPQSWDIVVTWAEGNVQTFTVNVLTGSTLQAPILGTIERDPGNTGDVVGETPLAVAVVDDTVTFSGEVAWYPADEALGRTAGNRVGVEINAPAGYDTSTTTFTVFGNTYNWDDVNDGDNFVWIYPKVTEVPQNWDVVVTWQPDVEQTFTVAVLTGSTLEIPQGTIVPDGGTGQVYGGEPLEITNVDGVVSYLGEIAWYPADEALGRTAGNRVGVKITARPGFDTSNTIFTFAGSTYTWNEVRDGDDVDNFVWIYPKVTSVPQTWEIFVVWEEGNTQEFSVKVLYGSTLQGPQGTIEPDGGTGQVPGGEALVITNEHDVVSYLGEIAWYPANDAIGRTAGNRVGVEINAPAGFDTTGTTFTVFGNTYTWDEVKDGDNFVWIYPLVTEVPQSWDIVVTWAEGNVQTFTVNVLTGSTLQAPILGTIERDPGNTGDVVGETPLAVAVVDDTVTFSGKVAWYPADEALGRTAGNRVGVEINAPAGLDTTGTTFTVFGNTYTWDDVNDGDNFVWIYPKVTEVPQNWDVVVTWEEGNVQAFSIEVLEGSTLQDPIIGTIEPDGGTGQVIGGDPLEITNVDGVVSYLGEIAWYPADEALGRTAGNRVGVEINAPAGYDTSTTTFTVFGNTYTWDEVKDGDNFVWIYPKVTTTPQEWDIVVTWQPGVEQTFTVKVLTGSTLQDPIIGTIEPDGGTGQVLGGEPLVITSENDVVSYLGEIAWYPADEALGRTAGNRVGVEINAPAGYDTSTTTFTVFGNTYNWDDVNDGDNFVWIYPKVTTTPQEWDIVVTWQPGIDQTFTVKVLTGSTLQAPIIGTIERDPGNTGDVLGGTPLVVVVADDAVTFSGEVAWYPADEALGRTAGNRVGVEINAPAGYDTSTTTFTVFGNTYNWDDVNDGDNFVWIYPKVTEVPQSWDIVVTWQPGVTQTFTVEVLTGSTLDVPPTVVSGIAIGATGFDDVTAVDLTFTVDQGYTVDHIEITMSEDVNVAPDTEVSFEGLPYGTITADGEILTLTPYPGNEVAAMLGEFTFSVPAGSVTNSAGNSPENLSATLIVNNVAPEALDDAYTTNEDVVLDVPARGVLANDTDFDPANLTAVVVTEPANGTLVLNADGSFTYSPDADFFGTDTFTYKANDGELDSNIATVTITVTEYKDQVIAVDDEYETDEDTTLTIAAPGVLANDIDVDLNIMTAGLVTDVQNGTLTLNVDGSFTYDPDPDFYGTDSFEYQLITYPAPQSLWTDEATVTITVNPIGDAPVLDLIEDATIPEEVEFSFTATATDPDLPDDVLTFSLVGAPDGAAITEAGVFTWTPSEEQGPGTYTFTVKVCDDTDPAPLCDEQEVTLTVTEVNTAPVAQDLIATTLEDTPVDVTLVATDAEDDALTYAIVDQPAHGTVTLVGTTATYTPALNFNGEDSFTYKANDGLVDSVMAVVTITVTPVNDWPIANDDSYETVTGVLLDVAAPGVLDNDVLLDPDEVVSITILDEPQHGTLSMNDDGSFTYTPDAGFMGTDTFRYQLNSVQLHAEWSDDALVTIVVKPYMGLFLPIIWR